MKATPLELAVAFVSAGWVQFGNDGRSRASGISRLIRLSISANAGVMFTSRDPVYSALDIMTLLPSLTWLHKISDAS